MTTSVSAAPEIIDHEETGIIVPPRDAAAIEQAVLELMENSARVEEMGREARRRAAARFNFSTMMKRYEHCYLDWLDAQLAGRLKAARRSV